VPWFRIKKPPNDRQLRGSITFSDLIGKNAECGREGRSSVARLIERHGRDGKLTDWLAGIIADWPTRRSFDMSDQCGALNPDLSRVI
jgi:hypothetical protein